MVFYEERQEEVAYRRTTRRSYKALPGSVTLFLCIPDTVRAVLELTCYQVF